MEGSFWALGHDLADLYRDEMTLRQLWVRTKVILSDPNSLLVRAIARAAAEAEEVEQVTGIDDALALVSKRPIGG